MANGQETGIEILRGVIALRARGGDWNSVRDFHQGQRSATALKGRIHDRTPTRLPKHQKALAERGPSIHDTAVVTVTQASWELIEVPTLSTPCPALAVRRTASLRSPMAPGIHVLLCRQNVDCRDKPGHDVATFRRDVATLVLGSLTRLVRRVDRL